jgi:hypothetical protein
VSLFITVPQVLWVLTRIRPAASDMP